MRTDRLLSELLEGGIQLWAEGDEICFEGPRDAITPALRAEILNQRPAIVARLGEGRKLAHPSFAQQRLWFIDQLERCNAAYNVHSAWWLRGRLDIPSLERTIAEIVRRHEPLRTVFATIDGRPVQVITLPRNGAATAAAVRAPFAVVDLGHLAAAGRRAEARRLATAEADRPFELATGPLLRTTLFRLGGDEHLMLLTLHHIIADGWSQGVFFRELTALHEALASAGPSPLPEPPLQYAEFAAWQRAWLRGKVLEEQLSYWREKIAGAPSALELPTDRPRPAVRSYRGAVHRLALSADLTASLQRLSRERGASLYMTLLAAFMALLHRYCGQDDVLVGSPIANRNREEIEGLIGFFVNTLVLRGDLSGNPRFYELLERVRQTAVEAYTHQDLPFEKLVEELAPERDPGRHPLFQVTCALQPAPGAVGKLGGVSPESAAIDFRTARFDLELYLWEPPAAANAGALSGFLVYNTDLFEAPSIARLASHFANLLGEVAARADLRLSELRLLSPAQIHQQQVEYNVTRPAAASQLGLHQLFEQQVERTPEAVAVVSTAPATGNRVLSYRELDRRANRLAHHLRDLGVGPETLVGILVERSPEMVIGLLAILKAGGAYLPLDPAHPDERLAFMLEDAGVTVLLAHSGLRERLPATAATVVWLDAESVATPAIATAGTAAAEAPPAVAGGPANLAYAIYTSGSTGRPKGVGVTHAQVARLFESTRERFDFGPGDVWTLFHSMAFDFSVWELWGALLHGGRLVVVPYLVSRSPEAFRELLANAAVTVLNQTPSAFRMLIPADAEAPRDLALRWVIFGGEALDPGSLIPWFERHGDQRPQLVNMYGITETTVHVTWRPISEADARRARGSLIGRQLPDLQGVVLDASMSPVPMAVPGELFVGGAGVTRGYLGRPGLTAERFVPSPLAGQPGARLYRTGDRVRMVGDGELEYLGRVDHQVKIRGHRIELGEIETVLQQHPAVKQTVALVHAAPAALGRGDLPADRRLVAYVVPDPHGAAPSASELRRLLGAKLPAVMVPSAVVLTAALPLTASGKIDRAALARRALPASEVERPDPQTAFAAPRTPVEEILAAIWGQILGYERIGIHDNFFELGGHSLLATQVVSRVRETFQAELSLRSLFERPTVAELASVIAGTRSEASLPLRREARDQDLPLSFAQQRLWFLHQLEPANPAYNMPAAFRLTGRLDPAALEACFREIVRRHESLRTTFPSVDGSPRQRIAPRATLALPIVDLDRIAPSRRQAEARRLASDDGRRPFELAHRPPLRVTLMRLDAQLHVLLVNLHHIASDGWSQGVFYRELAAIYEAFSAGHPSPLPELPIQYADFAVWQRRWLRDKTLELQLSYWKEQLGDDPSPLRLPIDRPRPAVQSYRGSVQRMQLSAELTRALRGLSFENGASLYMTLLAGFMALVYRHTGQEDIVVGSPIANRNRQEIEALIGFFVNSLALRASLSADLGFTELLEQIREVALGAYAHQDLPFERLVEELQPERDLGRNPLFQVMFALQNAPSSEVRLPGLRLSPAELEFKQVRLDLEVHLWEADDGTVDGGFAYSTDLFDATTIARMVNHFAHLLGEIAANPDRRLAELPAATPAVLHQLLVEGNDTVADYPRHACLQQVFAEQAARTPDAVAVEAAGRQLSYRELDRWADGVAEHLRTLGVAAETLVGVSVERSPEMVVSLLGILKAGGAYVPLDPDYPRERLAFMLQDAGISVLLTQKALAKRLPDHDTRVVCLETIRTRSEHPLRRSQSGNDSVWAQQLAYVVFTSGSTGRPKGVSATHRGVLRLVRGSNYARLTADEVFLQLAPVAFDASTLELWGPLLNGGRLVLMPPEMPSLEDLGRALRRHRITTLFLTTGLFHLMVDNRLADLGGVRQLLTGGEVGSPVHFRRVLDHPFEGTLSHVYGPTECTTFTSYHPVPHRASFEAGGSVPIGRPIASTELYVVDTSADPVPMGVAGELWVGGAGLARGYLNRPELTAEKFVPNPFAAEPGERLYRSGDLVRCLPDGNVDFLGRIDQQVKVRGFRIELGEIEAVLEEHPAVREAVVLAREASGDGNLSDAKRLVAFLLPDARNRDEGDPVAADWAEEHIAHWQTLYEDLYEPEPAAGAASDQDGSFDIVGWNSSYTDQPIPEAEMREWLDNTISRIASLGPSRVLEIGCGTGLLLLRLAPGCARYLGTDFSPTVLRTLRARLTEPDRRLSQVDLVCKTANDFEGIDPGAFDTVILNSVVQYFPSIEYLLGVLRGAVEVTAPGGAIYVGDVRSLPLLEAFCASVELHQADDSLSFAELRERMQRRLAGEEELVIDPAFFAALQRELPRIREVRILPKGGRSRNELTHFRYDVVLRLAPEATPAEAGVEGTGTSEKTVVLDWRQAELTLPVLREALEERRPAALRLRRVPNRRLTNQARLVEVLSSSDERSVPDTVAGLRELLRDSSSDGVAPADLEDLSRELSYSVELSWSELGADGSYDVLLWRSADGAPSWGTLGAGKAIRPWSTYGNNPLERKVANRLVPQLREYLEGRLPEHMLPAAFVLIEAFPLSPTGKVDRAELARRPIPVFDGARPDLENTLVAPRTSTERKLAAIWSEVLGVDEIGVHDNLFELGGDSILSIRIVAKANQEGMRLSPKDLFQHQTVADLAEIVGADPVRTEPREAGSPRAGESVLSGPVPLTPIQRWFFERDLPEPRHFNQSLLVEVRQRLDPALLQAAIGRLVEHHDALRLRFRREGAEWRQVHADCRREVPWIQVDLTAVAEADAVRSLEAEAARLQASLDLEAGPILRFAFFDFGRVRRSCQADRLLIAIHHLAVDSVSWRILLADLESACRQLAADQPVAIPPRSTSFHEWAERLAAHAPSEELREELDYWLARPRHVGRLPSDFDGANTMASADTVSVALGADETRRLLREVPAAYRTRIDDVLLTALTRTLARRTGRRSLAVELEGHGREEIFDGIDLSRTVGWFTSTFPVVLELDGAAGDGEALKTVKEQLRAVPRRGIGHGLLRYLCPDPEVVAKLRSLPQPEVSFNYLGQLDAELSESSLFHPAEESTGPTQSRQGLRSRLLEINGAVTGGRLEVQWTYSRNRHRRTTIEELAQGFLAEIETLIAHCLSPAAGGYTPSDFPLAGLDPKQLDRLIEEKLGARDGEIEDVYPLSPMQQGMLFHTLYSPASAVYFEQLNIGLGADVDTAVFRRAWQRGVERHGVLRTAFAWEGLERPLQLVYRQATLPWEEHDWRGLEAERQKARLEELLATDRERGLDLRQAPLMRMILVRLDDDEYRFIWCFHHLLLDGWSAAQLLAEVCAFWEAFHCGEELERRRSRPYRDYIAWLAQQDRAPAEHFWRRTLAGFTQPTPLVAQTPGSRERDQVATAAGHDQEHVRLPAATTAALSAFARRHQLTLNTLIQGAWALLLARMSGEDDVVFGVTVSGRPPSLPGSEAMIGILINTLPLRVRVAAREPLLPWLRRLQEHNAEIRQYESMALVDVQAWSEVPNTLPLFESLVVFENFPVDPSLGDGHGRLKIGEIEAFEETNYSLTLVAAPGAFGAVRQLSLRLMYEPTRFSAVAIHRTLNHLRGLLAGMVACPRATKALGALPLLTEVERHQLLSEWSATRWTGHQASYPRHLCLHQLFEALVERTPDRVAVVLEAGNEPAKSLTYLELNRRANQLAHHLRTLGVGTETPVGLCVERSAEMVVSLLAILKAGGAYVPLDPSYPRDRVEFMLRDAGVSLLLTQKALRHRIAPGAHQGDPPRDQDTQVICLETSRAVITRASFENPVSEASARNLAYIMYTSGSTGRPKGVSVTHRGVMRLVRENDYARLSEDEVFLQLAPVSFDASTLEIWGSMLNGARLVVMSPSEPSLAELGRVLKRHRVTTLWLTAGLFHLMVDEQLADLRGLRQLLAGGDVLSPSRVGKALSELADGTLINGYGPTESTTFACCYSMRHRTQAAAPVPIGRPIGYTRVYVVDRSLELVPSGVAGELWIGGDGLARGYGNLPELTAAKFVPNPFADEPGERLYRTGDLVRHLPDGLIEFLGRIDHQVKNRGFRIELGEIEAVLEQHPGVREAVVMARPVSGVGAPGAEGLAEDRRLVAYVGPDRKHGDGTEAEALTPGALRAFLCEKLPEFMVPAVFMLMEALPLSPSGKVDRTALGQLVPDRHALAATESSDSRATVAGPRTSVEEILAGIWCRVLGLGRIGIHDNFFELGGHSLMATQVISRVRQSFRVDLPLRRLFECPTVAELAPCVESARRGEALESASSPPLRRVARDRDLPLSFAQQRLWFLHQLEPASSAYNMPAAFRLEGGLDPAALEACFHEIVERHESLRTTFSNVDGRPIQVIALPTRLRLPIVDLDRLPESTSRDEALRLAHRDAVRPFDLARGPVLRILLLRIAEQEHILLVNFHHIASDGWSLGVFQRELGSLYQALSAGHPSPLPELPVQYADFAVWQREWLLGGPTPNEVLENQMAYWREQLGADLPMLRVPADRPRRGWSAAESHRGAVVTMELPESLARSLRKLSLDAGASLYMTLLAAFMALLYRTSGQRDIVVGSPIANRNRKEIEGLIGFFVNNLVMRGDLSGNPSFQELMGRVRETSLGAFSHQDLPFERLVEELHPERELDLNPLFQVVFALQNAPRSEEQLLGLNFSPVELDLLRVRVDIELHLWESSARTAAGGLTGLLVYNTALFDATTIARWAGHFENLLEGIAVCPELRLAELPLHSPTQLHQLLAEWNDTRAEYPHQRCFHQLFEDQAKRTPEAVALVLAGADDSAPTGAAAALTYRELNRQANRLAHRLCSLGVGPERLVGLCAERSIEMVVGLLAILKAGGAFVPLDPAYPRQRLAFMLEDAGVTMLLTQDKLLDRLPIEGLQVVCLDRLATAMTRERAGDPVCRTSSHNLAYVIYTSGSTGRPKGAMLHHRGLCNLAGEVTHQGRLGDSVLQFASLSFDASVSELVRALTAGAALHLSDGGPPLPGPPLVDFLRRHGINEAVLPPSALAALPATTAHELPALRTVLVAGEACPADLPAAWAGTRRFFNAYGPTETTICATVAECEARVGKPPIGRPITNTRIYLLDGHLNPVPVGVPGELHIGGAGLGRGYLHRPALTAERFIPNPFGAALGDPGSRLYKTGDLARTQSDGELEFLDRIDHQVKLRGYRIELGEVETVLAQHQAVRDAVVVAREDVPGDRRLVAYLVHDPQYLDDPDEAREGCQDKHVAQWQSLYEDLYDRNSPRQASPSPDASFNIAGWDSSYTGQPLPAEEMREWVDNTVERILSLRPCNRPPRRVLEIGCGTGLLLFRIAPHCTHYLGTDFSPAVLDTLRSQLASPDHPLSHVNLLHRTAEDFQGIEAGAFDTVIVNSVVQYFPSINYLLRVLRGAVETAAPGGTIFLGDVRSLPLLEAFCASVELFKADDSLSISELRERVHKRLMQEKELVIDPAFFAALKRELPRIRDIRILPKGGWAHNELTRFRYDVILQLDRVTSEPNWTPEAAWLDWQQEELTLAGLRQYLDEHQPSVVGIRRVPNRRLAKEVRLLELLSSRDGIETGPHPDRHRQTVAELREELRRSHPEGMEPEQFRALGREASYAVEVSWSELGSDGSYSVLFGRSTGEMPGIGAPGIGAVKPWAAYANNPLRGRVARQLVPRLQEDLKQRLPEYMVPAAFVLLETLPLSPNGKVDRRALPVPDGVRSDLHDDIVLPRTPTEAALAEIYSELLGVERVGVRDGFFELGGHSLLAVRLMAQIEQRFAVKLPLATLFRESSVEGLATMIGNREPAAAFSPLVKIQPNGSKPPFFCVHPGGGNVLCYSALSRHLDDQPFYGFQARGSEGGTVFDPDLPSMAARYLEAMRALQPRGPYRLGGWSMGGVVAFEMAQQLLADGEEVALLALLDSVVPSSETPVPPDESAFLTAFAHDLGLHDFGLTRADQPQPLHQEPLRRILDRARQSGLLPANVDIARIRHLYCLFRNNITAMLRYVPQPYEDKIVLVRPQDRPSDNNSVDLGWNELAAGGVELATVPGNHFTMVREPHVRVLAERLSSLLQHRG